MGVYVDGELMWVVTLALRSEEVAVELEVGERRSILFCCGLEDSVVVALLLTLIQRIASAPYPNFRIA